MTYTWIIYKATGKCGRGYIGLTRQGIEIRWKQHMKFARRGSPQAIHRAIKKYGADWFTVEAICECYSEKEAVVCEKAMIASHNTFAPNGFGFNLTTGGDYAVAHAPRTAETRAKLSAALKGKKQSPERAEQSRKSLEKMRPLVDAERRNARLSATHKAIWNTPERLAERRALMGSEKVRANKRAAMAIVAKNISEDRRQKMSETITAVNKSAKVKRLKWCLYQYESALAARIGRKRPHVFRSDKGTHKPQSDASISAMSKTKRVQSMWKSAMAERSRRAHEQLRAGMK